MAIAATITLALCSLVVVAADDEDASAFMQTTRLLDGVRGQPFTNNERPLSSGYRTRDEDDERHALPSLTDLSRAELDLTASQQKSVLAKLAAEKRRLRGILAHHRRSDNAKRRVREESPRRAHRYARPWARREVFADEQMPSQKSRPDSDESEALVEHSSAMFRAAMEAEVKQTAKDRKRQAAIERDEEELEEEQAMAFRAKLHEKDHKSRVQKAHLLRQLRQYKRKDRMSQQMIKDAEEEATQNAAQAARAAAAKVAGRLQKELMSDVRRNFPQQISKLGMQDSAAAGAVTQPAADDLVTVEPAQTTDAQTAKSRDPEVTRLKGEIAHLQQALAAKKIVKAQPVVSPEAAPLKAQPAVAPVAAPPATPLIMEDDSIGKVAPKASVQKAANVVEKAAPKQPKSARVVPQPVRQQPVPDLADEPSVVDVVPEKPQHRPVQVAEPTPSDEEEPTIEGGENEQQAEYTLIAYAIWGSVGALVLGIFSTIVYCACQQPRDRPWGMPPKRQF
jgi:hypothetical protein